MVNLTLYAPENLPEIREGDSVSGKLAEALEGFPLKDGDIVMISHKIVSKAEGRMIRLSDLPVSEAARRLAAKTGRDPALVQVILNESKEILWAEQPNAPIICLHRRGYICANAAVDCSNSRPGYAITLPEDPDRSARQLRLELEAAFRARLGVIICDTHGRAFREGACGMAVGASGVTALKSYIGQTDRAGRKMESSVECWADELAAAATLLMGQCAEGRPAVILRGAEMLGTQTGADLIRPETRDLFLQALRAGKTSVTLAPD